MTGRILVVDDNPTVVGLVTEHFTAEGYHVDGALHGGDAVMAMAHHRPDVVLLDLEMEGLGGLDVLEHIQATDPTIPVIIVSAWGDPALQQRARTMGAFDYVVKPFSLSRLQEFVLAALPGADAHTAPPTT